MHEMGIALQIVEIATASIPPDLDGARVARVNLKVGKLAAIVPDSLRFCFGVATKDTPLDGAELAIEELPVLAQWKMMGPGEYVCGLEPSTHEMAPTRRGLRERGLPRELAPGASSELRLEIGSLPDADAIARFEASLPSA